jgi:hypothetical protein
MCKISGASELILKRIYALDATNLGNAASTLDAACSVRAASYKGTRC